MEEKPSFGAQHTDDDWGCVHREVNSSVSDKIKLCHVDISDIEKIATELSKSIMDTSWIMEMDPGARRSYNRTVSDTANSLVQVFNNALNNQVTGEFGELMVSMGSARSLEVIFQHASLPISELWKPQRKQNEGFDFHTVCEEKLANFGEAKFKSTTYPSPYSDAANQANGFFENEKHYRDRVHLLNLVEADVISQLDDGHCGMVIAFSMNAVTPLTIYENAIAKVQTLSFFDRLDYVYIVGVKNEG